VPPPGPRRAEAWPTGIHSEDSVAMCQKALWSGSSIRDIKDPTIPSVPRKTVGLLEVPFQPVL